MEFLLEVLEHSEWPLVSAFVLGLMTAISPCPLATNITAIAYISKDIENNKRVFLSGIIYTLGRAISYMILGVILYLGAEQMNISGFFQKWGEKFLGPLLIVIGLLMLNIIKIKIPGSEKLNDKIEAIGKKGHLGVLLMGMAFALAFCPYSGVLYFGLLIPMTVASTQGLYLPLVFAIGTGIPVIIFAWLIAFTLNEVGSFYNNIKKFEKWFRKIAAMIFLIAGFYYFIVIYFNLL